MTKHELYNSGWDAAYHPNLNASDNGGHQVITLWQEGPVPYLQDRETLKLLRDRRVDTILEPGCGDGRNSRHLARNGFHVTAADISPTALEIGSKLGAQESLTGIVYVRQDATNLEFVGENFDAVICVDMLGQLEVPEVALKEFYRVLRPGGLLLFNVFTPSDSTCGVGEQVGPLEYAYKGTLFRYFTEEMVRELVSGWSDVRIRQFPWMDPPHGEFRPEPHMHDSWVVTAFKG